MFQSMDLINSKDLPQFLMEFQPRFCSWTIIISSSLFASYIGDLHPAIKFCKVHHFTDDTI